MSAGRDSGRDRTRMRRALELARRGWGRVAPNPLVGAVLVRDGEVVGEGWHAEHGGPHAEVEALREAEERVEGATLYVTLEPCAHRGKTPPCVDVLVEAGIGRAVVACRDPDPTAAGGIERLRTAGVEVDVGLEREAARRLNAPFLWRHRRGRPLVELKLAFSLDARIARRPGQRTSVTGDAAWSYVHHLRAGHGGVIVGRKTLEADDPRLTARGDVEPLNPPIRIVLATGLDVPTEAVLVRTAEEVPSWVVGGPDASPDRRRTLEAEGVRVLTAPVSPRGLEPGGVVTTLGDAGVPSLLVEGGGRVAASFLRADQVQRLHLLVAPMWLGPEGVEAFPELVEDRGDWRVRERRPLGEDTLLLLESEELGRFIANGA